MESCRRNSHTLLVVFTLEFHSVWVVKTNQLISLSSNHHFPQLILRNCSSVLLGFTSLYGNIWFKSDWAMFFSKTCLVWVIHVWSKLLYKISCKLLSHTNLSFIPISFFSVFWPQPSLVYSSSMRSIFQMKKLRQRKTRTKQKTSL